MNVLAVEMEAAALYMNAAYNRDKRAGYDDHQRSLRDRGEGHGRGTSELVH